MQEEDRIAIYLSHQHSPYMTLEIQEEVCRTECKMRELNHLTMFREFERNKKVVLDKLIEDSRYYKYIVIYSLSCLDGTLPGITHYLKKIIDANVEFLSVMDPINLKEFGANSSATVIMSACIAHALHTHNVWENIIEFKSEN